MLSFEINHVADPHEPKKSCNLGKFVMKFVLYSDIHAQLAQLEAVQEAVDKENADKEIVAGDLVMLGPDPGPVVENIRNRKKL